jgi:hypothetical protein
MIVWFAGELGLVFFGDGLSGPTGEADTSWIECLVEEWARTSVDIMYMDSLVGYTGFLYRTSVNAFVCYKYSLQGVSKNLNIVPRSLTGTFFRHLYTKTAKYDQILVARIGSFILLHLTSSSLFMLEMT